jgi:hypothetical protein
MKLRQIVEQLGLRRLTPDLVEQEEVEVSGGHASDLLSDVLANAPPGGVAITIQGHLNTIAVALHARLAAVILAAGRTPDDDVIEHANEEHVPLYVSDEATFDIAGKLYALGLRGQKR